MLYHVAGGAPRWIAASSRGRVDQETFSGRADFAQEMGHVGLWERYDGLTVGDCGASINLVLCIFAHGTRSSGDGREAEYGGE